MCTAIFTRDVEEMTGVRPGPYWHKFLLKVSFVKYYCLQWLHLFIDNLAFCFTHFNHGDFSFVGGSRNA
jgi:hypothetical protein